MDSVEALIDWGAKLNLTDGDERTALHLAAREGNVDSVVALIN